MAQYQIDCKRYFGNIWRTSILFHDTVFVANDSLSKELYQVERTRKNATSACFPPHHKALFGQHSVLVTSGQEHLRLRSLIGPTLVPKQYMSEISSSACEFIEQCSLKKGYFPLVPELKRFSLRVMLRVLFGNELWIELKSTRQLDALIDDINTWSLGLLAPPTSFLPWTIAGRAMRARSRIHDKVIDIMSQLRRENSGNSTSSNRKVSLLANLMESIVKSEDGSSSCLFNDAIVDNILTLLFAGSDTTSSVLTSSFFVLAQDKALLKRLQGSVDDVKVIEAFLTETQRLYPAAPFTMRVVGAEDGLRLGQYHIPKSWYITYALAAILLDDESIYPNRNKFDMDRWLSSPNKDDIRGESSNPSLSISPIWSFGAGNRMCPGRFLANAEGVSLLQEVLRKGWDWSLDPLQNLTYRYNPGFFPVQGLRIQLNHGI